MKKKEIRLFKYLNKYCEDRNMIHCITANDRKFVIEGMLFECVATNIEDIVRKACILMDVGINTSIDYCLNETYRLTIELQGE